MTENNGRSTGLKIAILSGLIGALFIAFFLIGSLNTTDRYHEVSAGRLYETGLFISEAIILICFSLLALYQLQVNSAPGLNLGACFLRVTLLLLQYSKNWDQGWNYIMENRASPTQGSWILLGIGIIQAIAFIVAAIQSSRKKEHIPEEPAEITRTGT